MASVGDWEQNLVVYELTKGHEFTKQLISNHISPSSPAELLTQKILCSFRKAISILKSSDLEGEPQLTGLASASDSPHSISESPCSGQNSVRPFVDFDCKPASKKRKTLPKWSEHVRVSPGASLEGPPDDGKNWRKYGQKDILGAKNPRAYYRCTHRNVQGCMAKKQVQRSEEDPFVFNVMYQGTHTCKQAAQLNSTTTPTTASNSIELSQLELLPPPPPPDQQQLLLNFRAGLKVKTEDLNTKDYQHSSSFSFPCASFDNPFTAATFSSPFMSPATSESNYFSLSPCHMNSSNGGGPTMPGFDSDFNEIISAVTSASNSSLGDLDFNLDPIDPSLHFDDFLS